MNNNGVPENERKKANMEEKRQTYIKSGEGNKIKELIKTFLENDIKSYPINPTLLNGLKNELFFKTAEIDDPKYIRNTASALSTYCNNTRNQNRENYCRNILAYFTGYNPIPNVGTTKFNKYIPITKNENRLPNLKSPVQNLFNKMSGKSRKSRKSRKTRKNRK